MKLNANEYLALDFILARTCDYDKLELVDMAKNDPESIDQGLLCDGDVEDLAERLGFTVNQAKGVLGSLVKKGLADVWENDVNGKSIQMMEVTAEGVLEWDKR